MFYLLQTLLGDEHDIPVPKTPPDTAMEPCGGGTRNNRSQNGARGFIKLGRLDFEIFYLVQTLSDDGHDITAPETLPDTAMEPCGGGTQANRSQNRARGFIEVDLDFGIFYFARTSKSLVRSPRKAQ